MCSCSTPQVVVDGESPLTSTCALEVPHQITHFQNFHQHQHVFYFVLGLAPSSCFEKTWTKSTFGLSRLRSPIIITIDFCCLETTLVLWT